MSLSISAKQFSIAPEAVAAHRRKGSLPKWIFPNPALVDPSASRGDGSGFVFENLVGAHLLNVIYQRPRFELSYFRESDFEVDFILTESGQPLLALEVKSGRPKRVPSAAALQKHGISCPLRTGWSGSGDVTHKGKTLHNTGKREEIMPVIAPQQGMKPMPELPDVARFTSFADLSGEEVVALLKQVEPEEGWGVTSLLFIDAFVRDYPWAREPYSWISSRIREFEDGLRRLSGAGIVKRVSEITDETERRAALAQLAHLEELLRSPEALADRLLLQKTCRLNEAQHPFSEALRLTLAAEREEYRNILDSPQFHREVLSFFKARPHVIPANGIVFFLERLDERRSEITSPHFKRAIETLENILGKKGVTRYSQLRWAEFVLKEGETWSTVTASEVVMRATRIGNAVKGFRDFYGISPRSRDEFESLATLGEDTVAELFREDTRALWATTEGKRHFSKPGDVVRGFLSGLVDPLRKLGGENGTLLEVAATVEKHIGLFGYSWKTVPWMDLRPYFDKPLTLPEIEDDLKDDGLKSFIGEVSEKLSQWWKGRSIGDAVRVRSIYYTPQAAEWLRFNQLLQRHTPGMVELDVPDLTPKLALLEKMEAHPWLTAGRGPGVLGAELFLFGKTGTPAEQLERLAAADVVITALEQDWRVSKGKVATVFAVLESEELLQLITSSDGRSKFETLRSLYDPKNGMQQWQAPTLETITEDLPRVLKHFDFFQSRAEDLRKFLGATPDLAELASFAQSVPPPHFDRFLTLATVCNERFQVPLTELRHSFDPAVLADEGGVNQMMTILKSSDFLQTFNEELAALKASTPRAPSHRSATLGLLIGRLKL